MNPLEAIAALLGGGMSTAGKLMLQDTYRRQDQAREDGQRREARFLEDRRWGEGLAREAARNYQTDQQREEERRRYADETAYRRGRDKIGDERYTTEERRRAEQALAVLEQIRASTAANRALARERDRRDVPGAGTGGPDLADLQGYSRVLGAVRDDAASELTAAERATPEWSRNSVVGAMNPDSAGYTNQREARLAPLRGRLTDVTRRMSRVEQDIGQRLGYDAAPQSPPPARQPTSGGRGHTMGARHSRTPGRATPNMAGQDSAAAVYRRLRAQGMAPEQAFAEMERMGFQAVD